MDIFFSSGRIRLRFWHLSGLYFSLFFQDVYFDDESAEVVISSLRLGDDQDGYFCCLAMFCHPLSLQNC